MKTKMYLANGGDYQLIGSAKRIKPRITNREALHSGDDNVLTGLLYSAYLLGERDGVKAERRTRAYFERMLDGEYK